MPAIQRGILPVPTGPDLETIGRDHRADSSASVSFLLQTGGDKRIWPDAITRRNRYGTRATPADDEISFSSTTASNISREGFQAASAGLARLIDIASPSPVASEQWFADIRDRIAGNLGCAGAQVVLAASGTDAELLALCMVAGVSRRPLTNVLVAPDETGNGVPRAAAGFHYSDLTALGSTVEAGAPLEGLPPDRIEVRTIAIRNETGEPRHQHDIDADIIATVEMELKRDRDVLVHVLDASKTGLPAVTRQAARHVAALAPDRVRVIVDACQFRGSISRLRQDLADGFLVALTGSKFVAGPPFSGALLIPTAFAEELAARSDIPAGLAEYSAAQDWPAALRQRTRFGFKSELNLGLGLRWVAALAHLDRYAAIDESRQSLVKEQFVRLVRSRIGAVKGISLHQDDEGDHLGSRAMVPLTVMNGAGAFASFEECQSIQLSMRGLDGGPICHVGQAVRLGSRTVLRVAASAPDVIGVAQAMSAGQPLHQAFAPMEARLDVFFHKLSAALHHHRGA
ncbi:hypothetical protein FJ930_16240 [Mesorhizobium sp. B2-4-15]|uniref:hypothetical protein n=1 Tax=Mesorhizobium sp. B2-4-15 TaxID=2589934 RepID=UPI00114E25C0|nr:hypothetical protein [Mesorhizobium sp. B2-4-15]TPK71163.1 hypothetical protein FJ930_16240 [Mesorhizobium sp. B2-4-15]